MISTTQTAKTQHPQGFNFKDRFAASKPAQYSIKIAETSEEVDSALRLRYQVFNLELGCQSDSESSSGLEFDEYDAIAEHLIVVDNITGATVGTYRVNSLETAKNVHNFYSYTEFSMEDLPLEMLASSIEIGRACVAREHRNSRVLLLLWKGVLAYAEQCNKEYIFGCCSIFTQNRQIGGQVFSQLVSDGHLHTDFRVTPRTEKICLDDDFYLVSQPVAIPSLFKSYLKLGAKICGEPIIDRDFKTIDFFVLFQLQPLSSGYGKRLQF